MENGESKFTVIIWDVDANFWQPLIIGLENAGIRVLCHPLPADYLGTIRNMLPVSLVAGELDLQDANGENVISVLHQQFPQIKLLPVVASPSVEGAIGAIRLGTIDYLLKANMTIDALLSLIKRVVLERQVPVLKSTLKHHPQDLIYCDPSMERLVQLARKAAASDATVLLQGESGTGKEVLARFVHRQSHRSAKPFVAINCAALPPNLLESELFGHEKGAFTGAIVRKVGKFELAHGGTVLLDEISEMDLGLQSKLLRVIQEGEVDRVGGRHPVPINVRIIATTNRVLKNEVEAGNFRQDLYYRLNVIPLTIKPLRERLMDIDLLVERFIDRYRRKNNRKIRGISAAARQALFRHSFPGNVRELENMIERGVVLAEGSLLEPSDLFLDEDELLAVANHGDSAAVKGNPADMIPGASLPLPVGTSLDSLERFMIFKTLKEVDNNRTHAARILGISIRTLRNKLREYREKYDQTPESNNQNAASKPA